MVGRTVVKASVFHPRTARHNASEAEVVNRLEGREIESVGRHGKFLVVGLDDGYTMVAHLGMSGRFRIGESSETTERHTHFIAVLDDHVELRFVDPRTFGFIAVYDEDELLSSGVSRLGPDAWLNPPSVSELRDAFAGRTAPVKALLLDQGPISGLGNIYADEALHMAGIHPLTPGAAIDDVGLEALLDGIRQVLGSAIERGGTTLDDLAYLLPDGAAGENLGQLRVYGRDGESCRVCGAVIEKTIVRARSTHFCPVCQAAS